MNKREKRLHFNIEYLLIIILFLYPLRHVNWGLDLWDTGYSYANFRFLSNMDSMWLFSTYLANITGAFLSNLPFAQSMIGMNVYTGIILSLLAVGGYLFVTRVLKIPIAFAFFGEILAISLSWCPTAVLYNYLTYVFFMACIILLYLGLVRDNNKLLIFAGIVLGLNAFVRFSNLSEVALVVAVWAYGVVEYFCDKKEGRKTDKKYWSKTLFRTLYCVLGYLISVFIVLGYICIRYGLGEYLNAIGRLFAMTDDAIDYKPMAMVMGVVDTFIQNMYWVIRIVFFALVGIALCMLIKKVFKEKCSKYICIFIGMGLSIAMVYWLYSKNFCAREYYYYHSIMWPGVTFMTLCLLIGVINIFNPNTSREEKLASGLMVLIIPITSLGSNNKVYPSINNLYLVAPYTLWQCYVFIRSACSGKYISLIPVKCVLIGFLTVFSVQSILFGMNFTFIEGDGKSKISEMTDYVQNNAVLRGVRMSSERAGWLQGLIDYANENEFAGREVILYGWIPGISYYLDMPSSFNPWSDLASYSIEAFAEALSKVDASDIDTRPVIIVEQQCLQEKDDEKWIMIEEFINDNSYEITYRNEKFVVLE